MIAAWRPVVGHPEYEVSDRGEVRSLERFIQRGGHVHHLRAKVLKPTFDRAGYARVGLSDSRSGKVQTRLVHRLVLEAFDRCRLPGEQCRHLNGVPGDNRRENLAWGTASENRYDQIRHGTHPTASKTHCPQGHAYTPENTYVSPTAGRTCKPCRRERDRRRRPRVTSVAKGVN